MCKKPLATELLGLQHGTVGLGLISLAVMPCHCGVWKTLEIDVLEVCVWYGFAVGLFSMNFLSTACHLQAVQAPFSKGKLPSVFLF